LNKNVGDTLADQLREDVELIEGVYPELDKEEYLSGKVAPVFFGSAINSFGVKEMLDTFINISPQPKERETDERLIKPNEDKFSGFVFKIHANMDPKHRNRIAFVRICSGKFQRGSSYLNVRHDKKFRFSNATAFMAQDKETVDEAFPGDIVGLFDTGNLKIGDTLSEGEKGIYKGIPSFSPEIFKEVINKDAMKTKQLEKGLTQLMDEGVAHRHIAKDKDGKMVFMAETKAWLQMVQDNFPEIEFHFQSEF
jgi:peptide chain release factor 3